MTAVVWAPAQPARGCPIEPLSRRELEVLELIAEGQSNAGIARRLYLSARTVEAVCSRIFIKLDLPPSEDVNRRVLAALVLLRGEHDPHT
ncbi:helix-turn-helix transcriptional regulator [Nocardioides panacisoli]|uniref:HTH luxR-type domain-containing protein n=1 Tax=Nocardioides panacisoli TaxID=627624 RepID=A0ABP7IL21_9ACTN